MFPRPVKKPCPEKSESVTTAEAARKPRRRHVSESNQKDHESKEEDIRIWKLAQEMQEQTINLCDKISLTIPPGSLSSDQRETLITMLSKPERCSLDLNTDEEPVSRIVDIMAKKGLKFKHHVILKFIVENAVHKCINCYKQEVESYTWDKIEKKGTDIYMDVDDKHAYIYTTHFTKFFCTCHRVPRNLGFDIVILGKYYNGGTPESAHEVEINVYTFDRLTDTQELDDFVEEARKYKDSHVGGIFRDVLNSVKEIQVTDKIEFILSLPEENEEWRDPRGNTREVKESLSIQRLTECHTRRRGPRVEAVQFILHTSKEASATLSATLSVNIENENDTSPEHRAAGEEEPSPVKYMRFSIPFTKKTESLNIKPAQNDITRGATLRESLSPKFSTEENTSELSAPCTTAHLQPREAHCIGSEVSSLQTSQTEIKATTIEIHQQNFYRNPHILYKYQQGPSAKEDVRHNLNDNRRETNVGASHAQVKNGVHVQSAEFDSQRIPSVLRTE